MPFSAFDLKSASRDKSTSQETASQETTPQKKIPWEIFSNIPIVIDTREQQPYQFAYPIKSLTAKLDFGDYSLWGYENRIAIERKTTEDFLGSITNGRDRFFRELKRMAEAEYRAVIVEGNFFEVAYPLRLINHESIIGTIIAIYQDFGIPVFCLSNRQLAQIWLLKFFERFLLKKESPTQSQSEVTHA